MTKELELLQSNIEDSMNYYQNPIEYFKSGFKTFDNLVGGFAKCRIYGLAASTGVGKTRFAEALCFKTAVTNPKKKLLFVGSEQDFNYFQFAQFSFTTGINERKFLEHKLSQSEINDYCNANIQTNVYYVNMNSEGYSMDALLETIKKYNIDIIFYDYLGAYVDAGDAYDNSLTLKNQVDRLSKFALENEVTFFITMQTSINIKQSDKKLIYDEQYISLSKLVAQKFDVGIIMTYDDDLPEYGNRRIDIYKHRWGYSYDKLGKPIRRSLIDFDLSNYSLKDTPEDINNNYFKSLFKETK